MFSMEQSYFKPTFKNMFFTYMVQNNSKSSKNLKNLYKLKHLLYT